MIKKKMLKMALEVQTNGWYRGMMVASITVGTMVVFSDGASALDLLPGGGTGNDLLDSLTDGSKTLFKDIADLSHPAAAVGIGIGAVMKKFSMGRQDRVETGNKLIRDSVIGWGTINGINAIIGTIETIMDGSGVPAP